MPFPLDARILVVGSANTDHIVFSQRLPRPGETVSGGHYKQAFGGKGANQAVAASRAGARVTMVGCLGSDSAGISYLENLKQNGIDTRWIRQDDRAASGIALIMVDEKGENCISVAAGANHLLHLGDVQAALGSGDFSLALLQMEIPVSILKDGISAIWEAGIPVMLNMAPFSPLDEEVLKKVQILVLNEVEATELTRHTFSGEEPTEPTLMMLFQSLAIPFIIITRGKEGVLLCASGEVSHHPAFKTKVVDSTAAGDTFCGYLAAGITSGMEMKDAIHFAQAASAICVGREGAQPSIPQSGEVKAFLNQISD
jgi:ribokinase